MNIKFEGENKRNGILILIRVKENHLIFSGFFWCLVMDDTPGCKFGCCMFQSHCFKSDVFISPNFVYFVFH